MYLPFWYHASHAPTTPPTPSTHNHAHSQHMHALHTHTHVGMDKGLMKPHFIQLLYLCQHGGEMTDFSGFLLHFAHHTSPTFGTSHTSFAHVHILHILQCSYILPVLHFAHINEQKQNKYYVQSNYLGNISSKY